MAQPGYLKTKNGTPNNAVHWITDPLDDDSLALLRRLNDGLRLRDSDRFNTAYLIARGCLHVDLDEWKFSITDKGRDALEFYGDDE